jgi:arginyl-tRNA synthetase
MDALGKVPDVSGEVERFTKSYESRAPEAVELVRRVAGLCLDGQRATLRRVGVDFDEWDWESDVVWSGEVETVLRMLAKTRYVKGEAGSHILQSDILLDAFGLRADFGLSATYEIPPLTLTRSDGSSLYATRDIAYTIRKFRDAERVVNVVGAEQRLPQLQLKLALVALGKKDLARNLVHYWYGLVELEGLKMSRRRGRFITFDELIHQAVNRAKAEVSKRQDELRQDESESIAETVALGAIRYSMLNVSSTKNITFSWDRVLSLERNSAPFINYAYTRATSIIRKLGALPSNADLKLLREPLERYLVYQLGKFPLLFEEAADSLRPEDLATFANSLAEKFHEYYEKFAVLRAESNDMRNARAQLVGAVAIVLRNCMDSLGIRLSEKM